MMRQVDHPIFLMFPLSRLSLCTHSVGNLICNRVGAERGADGPITLAA